MYIEYIIIPIFYIVRTYDSRGEENTTSSSDTSVTSSVEETPVYYHVIFQNYDGTKLYEVDVLEGDTAVYQGQTPKKPADEENDYTYSFSGWDKVLTNITSDLIVVATYSSTKINWGPGHWVG